MPFSHSEGRSWARDRLTRHPARVVVDFGAGEGTYSSLARDRNKFWIAVEAWEPYVVEYDLLSKYDAVVVENMLDYEFPGEGFIAVCGDVIEHLERADAVKFLSRLKESAAAVMVSVPVVTIKQGAWGGNPFETHRHQWKFKEMDSVMGRCESWRGRVLGRWWWTKKGASA